MPEYIGPVEIPAPVTLSAWPLTPDYGSGTEINPKIVTHTFGSANAKVEQRFYCGPGARRFRFVKNRLRQSEYASLATWFENASGVIAQFPFDALKPDGTTETVTVRFAEWGIELPVLTHALHSLGGLTFVEVQTSPLGPYSITSTQTRFPQSGLKTALLSQVQEIIPLLKITPRDGSAAIYLSDRKCTVGGTLYQPRLLEFGGIQQSIDENSDRATFVLGNADRVFTSLVNQVDLFRASVEFSLYHVGTGVKLDLWAGHVVGDQWSFDSGPRFTLNASDGLYELTLSYPTRTIIPQCHKDFNDGRFCPASAAGGTNLSTPCDKSYDGPAGCVFHNMQRYFGGIKINPNAARPKGSPNSGVIGSGRSSLTSVSNVNDTAYGKVLQQVYTDKAMKVSCEVASGRDDNDFYAAIGIVGEGIIGSFNADLTQHSLDNQPPHDPRNGGGYRYMQGFDPALEQDYFGIGQHPWSGPTAYPDSTYAAGVSCIEIRRSDEKGLQLAKVSDRSMTASVTQGCGGWVWSGPSGRSWQAGLTNPVWIMINCYLRAIGMWVDALKEAVISPEEMEAYFDVDAAVSAAAVCDTYVTKLIGSGTEKQFTYHGVMREQKPLRDWLREIQATYLGYYSFSCNKLRVGTRVSWPTPEAFGTGNMLFRSLSLTGRQPSFNHLTGQFADEEFDWQLNAVTVYDIDHAKRIGRGQLEYLRSTQTLVGTGDKSLASRLLSTRLREELGGITESEQRAARNLSFATTILALNVEPGAVCSLTHSDLPGGSALFRVRGWKLNQDYSIEITGSTLTNSMYDLTTGPRAVDVALNYTPVERFPLPPISAWHPNVEAPNVLDPLFDENDYTFSVKQEYNQLADMSSQAAITVTGRLNINATLPGVYPPQVRSVVVDSTGGTIPGGGNLWISLCVYNDDGYSAQSNIVQVAIGSATNTNKVTLGSIKWPAGTFTGYSVFAGTDPQLMCWQATVAGALPSTVVFSSPVKRSTWGPPRWDVQNVKIKAKRVLHGGVVGTPITAISGFNITCSELAGHADNWTGRALTVLADATDGSAAVWNFQVTAYNSTTGTFTVSSTGPDPTTVGVEVNDVVAVMLEAKAATSTTIQDTGIVNGLYPTGMTANSEAGYLIRIIAGKGRGQLRRIETNTADTWTIDEPWEVIPDSTSKFIVEFPTWEYFAESTRAKVRQPDIDTTLQLIADNLLRQTILVTGIVVDVDGNESPERLSPMRMIYMFGETATSFQLEYLDTTL